MAEILVLVRHAKAERGEEGKLDIERRLTESGKRSLAVTLPHSLSLVPAETGDVQIWSSPAARAQQTAKIMERALVRRGVNVDGDIRMVDTLWSQDIDAFMAEVRACEARVVVAVGHNPLIEDLTARLANSRIDFATGAFAAISLGVGEGGDVAADAGRLLWFVQGPVSQLWKPVVHMEHIVGTAADAVREKLDAFLAEPDDIETMHKFRVSVRTLRSLVAFIEPWQNADQNALVQDELKKLVAETSHLRELDVLFEQAASMEGATDEFVAFCAGNAAGERKRVIKALGSKKAAKQLGRVISELHDIKWRKHVNAEGLPATDVRARFDELADNLSRDLAELDLADVERTHDVRKAAKRVRYDAEKLKALLGDDAVDVAKNMVAHQDDLGAICDARVNIAIVNELDLSKLPEPVAWDLSLLRAQNETYLYTTLRAAT